MTQEREYITAVTINAGIITLIEPNGSIAEYRQRGISNIDRYTMVKLMGNGLLNPYWSHYKELPKNWSISYEDTEIMGRARASFPLPKVYQNKNKGREV